MRSRAQRPVKNLFRKLGFGLGTMKIQLDRPNYFLGQRLQGRVEFELEQATQAKSLQIQLKVTQKVRHPRTTTVYRNGQPQTETRDVEETIHLFKDVLTLDGPKEYARCSYPFALRLPHTLDKIGPSSEFGKFVEAVNTLRHGKMVRRSPLVWELKAWLEIPWSASLKNKLILQVSEPPAGIDPADLHEPPGFVRNFQTTPGARKLPKFCDQCGTARPEERTSCAGCGRNWT
jgi:hypothetical protein